MKDKKNSSGFQLLSIACLKDDMTMTELVKIITAELVQFIQIEYVTHQILLNADRQGWICLGDFDFRYVWRRRWFTVAVDCHGMGERVYLHLIYLNNFDYQLNLL